MAELNISLPSLKFKARGDTIPSPEEQAEFNKTWDDLINIDSDIARYESHIPTSTQDVGDKEQKLKELYEQRAKAGLPVAEEDKAGNGQKQDPVEHGKKEPENYFRRTGEFWSICFNGVESIPIKAVDGLKYIAYLLERPGISINSLTLFNIVKGNHVNNSDSFAHGLKADHRRQTINDSKTKKDYQDELDILETHIVTDVDPDERIIKQEAIDNQKALLKKKLNERAFTDEPTKKQSLISPS